MPRILITGAHSFIGTNFIKNSKFKEIDEVSLCNFSPDKIDFRNYDTVIHLAAIVHKTRRIPEREYFAINRDLAFRVAENARKAGVRQFIFLSTIKVYGKYVYGSEPWSEDSVCKPDDAYGRSKYEAEKAIQLLKNKEFIVSVIRTPIVYGPGVKANMLKFIKLIKKSPVLPFRGVENTRYYTFVENLVDYIDRIIELKSSGIFIAMDDNALSTSNLVLFLANVLHRKPYIFRLPGFVISTGFFLHPHLFERLYGSIRIDNSLTKKILNFTPRYSTEEGLKRTVLSCIETRKSNP